MATEIERKFLVNGNAWKQGRKSIYKQGYISTDPERVVRVRTINKKGILTIKGKTKGMTRQEYEYEIPFEDASELLNTICQKPLIEKARYLFPLEELVYEVDEFFGDNEGLVIAEVELHNEAQQIPRPDWLGEEVTNDPRYYNSNLVLNPYSKWKA